MQNASVHRSADQQTSSYWMPGYDLRNQELGVLESFGSLKTEALFHLVMLDGGLVGPVLVIQQRKVQQAKK